jgi:hypothetical protein
VHPRDHGTTIELPPEAAAWQTEIDRCKAEIAALEKLKAEADNKLRAAIGDATEAFAPGGYRWTYKVQKAKAYTVPEREYRVLRVKGDR